MNIAEPSPPRLPSQTLTVFSHPYTARYGQIIVWDGMWSWSRVCLEFDLRDQRAQDYITSCRKREFIRVACWTAAWCLFCWLV